MESNASEPLLDLLVRIKGERVRDEARRFKLPVDRGLWFNSPAVVDAYYAPNLNEMSNRNNLFVFSINGFEAISYF
jgi:predicted metalloendopeptidase